MLRATIAALAGAVIPVACIAPQGSQGTNYQHYRIADVLLGRTPSHGVYVMETVDEEVVRTQGQVWLTLPGMPLYGVPAGRYVSARVVEDVSPPPIPQQSGIPEPRLTVGDEYLVSTGHTGSESCQGVGRPLKRSERFVAFAWKAGGTGRGPDGRAAHAAYALSKYLCLDGAGRVVISDYSIGGGLEETATVPVDQFRGMVRMLYGASPSDARRHVRLACKDVTCPAGQMCFFGAGCAVVTDTGVPNDTGTFRPDGTDGIDTYDAGSFGRGSP